MLSKSQFTDLAFLAAHRGKSHQREITAGTDELKAVDPAYGEVWRAEASGEQPHTGGRE